MKEIELTQGAKSQVDDELYDVLNQYSWRLKRDKGVNYAIRNCYRNGVRTTIHMHTEIMNAKKGQMIDHINHNGLDNRTCNLRFADSSKNQMNRRALKVYTSKYKGVYFDKIAKKWRAKICFEKKQIYLGLFINEDDAARAYNKKAIELYGEFAYLNVIDG